MLRSTFLWLSEHQGIFNFVRRNGFARKFALRFVAGETLDDATHATRQLNARDVTVTLDLLGESVSNVEEAERARDEAIAILDAIRREKLAATISVKLTQMGLDIDTAVAARNMRQILEHARRQEAFVRIDMEASAYVQRTLDLFRHELFPEFGNLVGVVIQSMLRRSDQDIDDLNAVGARVRLVKGAYAEPPEVAFPDKREVDAAFARQTERLLDQGNYPAIATHDERLIEHTTAHASRRGIRPEQFEFQLLYGVRRDLQERLRREGYRVRVYVPFGTEWYPYLMRRLAERPANVAFIVGSVVRETVGRR